MSPPPRASEASCPACGGPLAPWRRVVAGEPSDPETYELLRCAACGSARTAAAAPPAAYETGVYSRVPPRAPRLVERVQALALAQPARMLARRLAPGASVLDAGAGRGRLVALLRARGFEARGIDPSERNVELAAAARAVEHGTLEQHDDSGLDAIVLWHVLEHLDEPGDGLARACGWLRPGGLALVAVPNLSSLQHRIAGSAWFHFDVPRHRVHLTRAGTMALLAQAGLEPVEERHLVWQHNVHGMWFALLSRLGMTPGFPFHLAKRNIRARPRDVALTALGVALLPVAFALEMVAAVLRRGGTIAVLSRRDTAPAGR